MLTSCSPQVGTGFNGTVRGEVVAHAPATDITRESRCQLAYASGTLLCLQTCAGGGDGPRLTIVDRIHLGQASEVTSGALHDAVMSIVLQPHLLHHGNSVLSVSGAQSHRSFPVHLFGDGRHVYLARPASSLDRCGGPRSTAGDNVVFEVYDPAADGMPLLRRVVPQLCSLCGQRSERMGPSFAAVGEFVAIVDAINWSSAGTVPCESTIESWHVDVEVPCPLRFRVWRPVGGTATSFQLVFEQVAHCVEGPQIVPCGLEASGLRLRPGDVFGLAAFSAGHAISIACVKSAAPAGAGPLVGRPGVAADSTLIATTESIAADVGSTRRFFPSGSTTALCFGAFVRPLEAASGGYSAGSDGKNDRFMRDLLPAHVLTHGVFYANGDTVCSVVPARLTAAPGSSSSRLVNICVQMSLRDGMIKLGRVMSTSGSGYFCYDTPNMSLWQVSSSCTLLTRHQSTVPSPWWWRTLVVGGFAARQSAGVVGVTGWATPESSSLLPVDTDDDGSVDSHASGARVVAVSDVISKIVDHCAHMAVMLDESEDCLLRCTAAGIPKDVMHGTRVRLHENAAVGEGGASRPSLFVDCIVTAVVRALRRC